MPKYYMKHHALTADPNAKWAFRWQESIDLPEEEAQRRNMQFEATGVLFELHPETEEETADNSLKEGELTSITLTEQDLINNPELIEQWFKAGDVATVDTKIEGPAETPAEGDPGDEQQ